MAGRREINDLKPIDNAVQGTVASYRAVTKVNAEVGPEILFRRSSLRCRGEDNTFERTLDDALECSGGVVATAR